MTDAYKRPVSGLSKKDFVLLEDGAPQNIASFEATDATHTQSAAIAAPQTILLIDELNTRFEDIAFARYSIRKLLKQGGGNLNQPTALMALSDLGIVVLQDYTRDAQLLEAALEHHRNGFSWRLEHGFYAAIGRLNMSLGALQQLAMASEGAPTRKNIVWISAGLPLFSSKSIDISDREKLFAAIKKLSDHLLQARVSVYTVDPRGVGNGITGSNVIDTRGQFDAYVQSLASEDQLSFGDIALQSLATQTGGRALFGRNDVDAEVASSITDGDTYYTLSYSPSNHKFDGGFRRIQVALPRTDLHSRTRNGYYALPEPAPLDDQESSYQLMQALVSPLQFTGISILECVVGTAPSKKNTTELKLTIDGNHLTWHKMPNGDLHTSLDIAAAELSPKRTLNHYISREYDFAISAQKTATMQRNLLRVNLKFQKGDLSQPVRVVALDIASGRIGSSDLSNQTSNSIPNIKVK